MNKVTAYAGSAFVGAAVSCGLTSALIGRLGNPSAASALVGAGLAGILIGPAVLGYQLEEETNRRIDMTLKTRKIWFAIGITAVILNALGASWLSGHILSDS